MVLEFKSFVKDVEKEMNKRRVEALRGAAKTMKEAIKKNTPVGKYTRTIAKKGSASKEDVRYREPGNLKKSLVTQRWPGSIGVGFTHPEGNHAHLVEYGHDLISHGVKVGHVEGTHFFSEAWNEKLPEVKKQIEDAFADL